MDKEIFLKIGKLGFTKKAILLLIATLFFTGVVLGAFIFIISIKPKTDFVSWYILTISPLSYYYIFKKLKKEVL